MKPQPPKYVDAPSKLPALMDLKGILANSKVKTTDNALYQTITQMIERLSRSRDLIVGDHHEIDNSINDINTVINSTITIVNGITEASFLTINDESDDLPNSIQLVAGAGITFTSVGGTIVVSSSGGSSGGTDHVVVTTGAEPGEILTDGFGEGMYIPYNP